MVTVSVVDETAAGARRDAWPLEIFDERLPLRAGTAITFLRLVPLVGG